MSKQPKEYVGEHIIVRYDSDICIHAAECVRGLPKVFEMGRKPWVVPDAASADEVEEIIRRCPSSALTFERVDD